MFNVLSCVFLQRRIADKKASEGEFCFTVVSLFVFVIDAFVEPIVNLLGGKCEESIALLRIVSISLSIVSWDFFEELFDGFGSALYQGFHLPRSIVRDMLGYNTHSLELCLERVYLLDQNPL